MSEGETCGKWYHRLDSNSGYLHTWDAPLTTRSFLPLVVFLFLGFLPFMDRTAEERQVKRVGKDMNQACARIGIIFCDQQV